MRRTTRQSASALAHNDRNAPGVAGNTKATKQKKKTIVDEIEDSTGSNSDSESDSQAKSATGSKNGFGLLPDDIEDDDDIKERTTTRDPFTGLSSSSGRSSTGGYKAKRTFHTKVQKETATFRAQKEEERLSVQDGKAGETKPAGFRRPAVAEALMANLARLENKGKEPPVEEPPKKPEILGLSRYQHVLKSNKIDLDPKLLALIAPELEGRDSGSDSDASSSSKKRKRETSGSPGDPIDIDAPDTNRPKKSRKSSSNDSYKCPICDAQVSKALYESYGPDLKKKLSLRRQLHRSHKVEKAHEDSKTLGLPDINWDELEERCEKYFPYLRDIMNGKAKSYYRDVAEAFWKKQSKKAANSGAMIDNKNWDREHPGYYGPRGRSIMEEAIASNKMIMAAVRKLNDRKDATISKGYAGAYITSVLLPELATRLIMEDMGIADDEIEKGRKLMIKTIEIGKILNDDDDDDRQDGGGGGGGRATGGFDANDEVNDGMNWWWKEEEEKRRLEEEAEREREENEDEEGDSQLGFGSSQTPLVIEDD